LVVQFIFRVLLTVGRVFGGLDPQRVTACLSRVDADKLQYGNCGATLPAVIGMIGTVVSRIPALELLPDPPNPPIHAELATGQWTLVGID
jgi:hypothetical protein